MECGEERGFPTYKGSGAANNFEFREKNPTYTTYPTCESNRDLTTKLAAAKAFPSVVGILSRKLPGNMAVSRGLDPDPLLRRIYGPPKQRPKGELVFWGCGIIIECETEEEEEDLITHKYLTTIICPATLFIRTNGIQPADIKVDVYLWDGKICEGKVFACDFHYNLAAVQIQSDSPLPTATLRPLDVAISVLPTHHFRPCSNLFNISPGTKIITLARTLKPLAHVVGSGTFGITPSHGRLDCNELYWVEKSKHPEKDGGAVINYAGEVIGLMFYDSPFLPINIVSSWWKHFKSSRQYHRPWLGVEIADLHSTCLDFLGQFIEKFPNVVRGVVVTKVADSSAYDSGIRPEDVIVKCDGKLVRSTLEGCFEFMLSTQKYNSIRTSPFFSPAHTVALRTQKLLDTLWNKVGESVELDVLRASDGKKLKLSLAVEEIVPDKFYQWKRTMWRMIP